MTSAIIQQKFQKRNTDTFPLLKERVPHMELCNGSAVIIDIAEERIAYTITSAGQLFGGVKDTIAKLQDKDIDVFIASGDRSGAIKKLANITGIPEDHAFATASTHRKAEIVSKLQDEGYKVMMVGDGPNDILAFEQADSAVLTTEQKDGDFPDKLKGYADFVIEDISEVLQIDF